MESLKKKYIKLLADHVTISVIDLSKVELELIEKSFELFEEKLDDIKILNDEIYRISLELANIKAMYVDKDDRNDNHHISDETDD